MISVGFKCLLSNAIICFRGRSYLPKDRCFEPQPPTRCRYSITRRQEVEVEREGNGRREWALFAPELTLEIPMSARRFSLQKLGSGNLAKLPLIVHTESKNRWSGFCCSKLQVWTLLSASRRGAAAGRSWSLFVTGYPPWSHRYRFWTNRARNLAYFFVDP